MTSVVSRALQVVAMDERQLKKLHGIEDRIKHLIPNWNVQEIFHLGTLKDRLGIPDDLEKQAQFMAHVDREIRKNDFVPKTVFEYPDMHVDWWHEFDWMVFHNQGKIVWEMSSSFGKRRLMDRVRTFVSAES